MIFIEKLIQKPNFLIYATTGATTRKAKMLDSVENPTE